MISRDIAIYYLLKRSNVIIKYGRFFKLFSSKFKKGYPKRNLVFDGLRRPVGAIKQNVELFVFWLVAFCSTKYYAFNLSQRSNLKIFCVRFVWSPKMSVADPREYAQKGGRKEKETSSNPANTLTGSPAEVFKREMRCNTAWLMSEYFKPTRLGTRWRALAIMS